MSFAAAPVDFRLDEQGAFELRLALRDAQAALQQALDQRFAAHGLTGLQVSVLDALRRQPELNLADIGAGLRMDAPAMSRHVARLEAKGLCLRYRPRDDRRAVRVQLLPAGLALAGQYPAALSSVTEQALAGFDEGERDELVHALQRMLRSPALND